MCVLFNSKKIKTKQTNKTKEEEKEKERKRKRRKKGSSKKNKHNAHHEQKRTLLINDDFDAREWEESEEVNEDEDI